MIARACIRGWLAVNTGSFGCGWGAEGRRGIDIWAGMGYFNRAGCDGQRYRSGHNGAGSKSARSTPLAKPANPHGAGLPEQEAAGKFSETLTICSQFSKSSFSACAVKRYRQRYRSGYNGPDSKSGVPAMVPWVRIPPAAPVGIASPKAGRAKAVRPVCFTMQGGDRPAAVDAPRDGSF